jgi:RNA polymerase sigma factor (sigma-70 family)
MPNPFRVVVTVSYGAGARRDCVLSQYREGVVGNPRRPLARTPVVASPSDEALVAGIASGDGGAMRSFVRRHQQRVFGLAVSVLGDRAGAEDVAQEAFLRAWRHAGSFDARRGSVTTWLLTITRNAAIDAARLRRSTPVDPEALMLLDLEGEGRRPDEVAVDRTEIDRVRVALRSLPVEQREALLLASVFSRTAAEIADQVGIPLGTAKTRIRSGLRSLRTQLAEGEVSR